MKMGVQPSYINVICEGLFKLHEISLFNFFFVLLLKYMYV